MSYHTGDLWKITATVTDPEGSNPETPVEPTALTVTITRPDNTTETPAAAKASTGVWKVSVNLTKPGHWRAVVATTGSYQASQPKSITVLED